MKKIIWAIILTLVSGDALADLEFGDWELKPGMQAIYDFQEYSGSVFTENDIDSTSDAYLRRLKASLDIDYGDNWSFEFQMEYKDREGETEIDDLNLNYQFTPHMKFTIGKFKEPLGLENQLSLRYQPLHERSIASNTLLFGRNSGIAFDIEHEFYSVDLAMTYLEAPTNTYRDSIAHIARFTFAPLQKKKRFVHFGLDFSTRAGAEDEYDINEPLLAHSVDNLLHSPNFAAREVKFNGVEFATRYKPLLFQAEHFTQRIKQDGLADQSLYGYYATLVYTFFGNVREYKHGKIKFEDKKPHTLEMAIRHSVSKMTPEFRGNDGEVTSIALSYFFKKIGRISLEYEDAELTDNGRVNSETLSGESLNTRIQLAF